MRIFLIWADKAEELKYLVGELKKKSHEVVYWAGIADGNENKISSPIFHEHNSAWSGEPAKGIDMSEYPSPGKDLIEKLYKTESLILTMMNKRFGGMCADERRHLYYRMLGYWSGIIKKYKPEAIIFPIVPHTVYNYIIYALAKLLNIKTIMFENTNVSDRLLLYNNWMEGSADLKKAVHKNSEKNFSTKDLGIDLQKYYKKQTDPNIDATPIYTKFYQLDNKGFRLLKRKLKVIMESIKDGTIIKKAPRFIINKLKPNLKKEYLNFQIKPDLERKFVYAPLSWQPERTTSPQGDMFADQILMIEILSAALPEDWAVYVKEHPSQWIFKSKANYSSSRYRGYYEKIAQLKNVILIPLNTDTFTLINKSQAVATVTGTAGWEALLRLKPAIIFGYPWYQDCPCLFKVSDVRSSKEAFKKIIDNFRIEEQKIINYLKSFDEATAHGYFEEIDAPDSELTKEENKKSIMQAILNELEKKNN
jgi:hypothetical protein